MKFYTEKVIQARQERRMSMSELALQSGISRSSLWAWETGKRVPSPANVRTIANVLEIDVSDISDLKPVKNITYKTYSKSLEALHKMSSITKKIKPEKINTLIEIVKSLEEELLYTSVITNALFSSLDFFFYIKDINQRYVTANQAFIKMLNLEENFDVFGKKDNSFFSIKEAAENSKQDDEVISNGKIVEDIEGFIPGTRKTRWGLICKLPIFDSNKDIIGVLGIFKDITEKRKEEQRRRILEHALDLVADGVWILELVDEKTFDYKLIYVNKFYESLTNRKKEELYKNSELWEDYVHPEDLKKMKLSRKTRKYPFVQTFRMKDYTGKELVIENRVRKFDNNRLIGIMRIIDNSLNIEK